MSVIWIIEQVRSNAPQLATSLIGDFAVRAFASLESFARLLRMRRSQLPDLLLIDGASQGWASELLQQLLAAHLPVTPVVYLAAADERAPAAARDLHYFTHVRDGLGLSTYLDLVLRNAHHPSKGQVIRFKNLLLDCQRLQCTSGPGEQPVALPLKEVQLLRLFLERPGVCFSRDEIRRLIWGPTNVTARTVDSHVSRLRRRLGTADVEIESVYGGGYLLRAGEAER